MDAVSHITAIALLRSSYDNNLQIIPRFLVLIGRYLVIDKSKNSHYSILSLNKNKIGKVEFLSRY